MEGNLAEYNFRPSMKGPIIEGGKRKFIYVDEMDWNDAEMVKRAYDWREQIFRRNIQRTRPTRLLWLQSEKSTVLSMLKDQFKRHHHPKWGKLADMYNQFMNGRTQRRGEKQVFEVKTNKGDIMLQDH